MKKILFSTFLIGCLVTANAQAIKTPSPSTSTSVKQEFGLSSIDLSYSRPNMKGRKIFGDLVPYNAVWRTGANDATTIEFSKAVKIDGKDLPAGKYSLFTIPGEKEWTIIFNKKWDQDGAWSYDQYKDQDALRVTVPSGKPAAFVETFTITVDKNKINLEWENTVVSFKVKG